MKSTSSFICTASILTLATGSADAATVLISDNFDGSSATLLSATSADTFDADIVTAGGSAGWTGVFTNPKADGTIAGNRGKANYLLLGSFINDAKGDTDAVFTLSVTVSAVGGATFGFSSTPDGFTTDGSTTIGGTAHDDILNGGFLFLDSGNAVYGFNGIGAGQDFTGSAAASGTGVAASPIQASLTIDLSAHNGVDNFGSISWAVGGVDFGSASFAADYHLNAIAILGSTSSAKQTADYDLLTLTQVPEPGSLALMGLGGMLIATRRRRL